MISNDSLPEQPDDTPETQKHRRYARYDVVVINTFSDLDADAQAQAQQNLIKTLKATPAQIAHLFDNASTVIKRGVDTDKARRYASVLRDAGLECRLEYVPPSSIERPATKAVNKPAPDFSATATQPTPRAHVLDASDKQYRMGLLQVIVGLLLLAGLLVMCMPQFSDLLVRRAEVPRVVSPSASMPLKTSDTTPAPLPSPVLPPVPPPVETTVETTVLQSVAATDGKATMQVPPDWDTALKMHPDAYLQTGNNARQLYILVMREQKSDAKKITIGEYRQAVEQQMVDGQAGAVVTPLQNPEPIATMPASGFELHLTRNNMEMVYLVEVVEDNNWLYQFIGITPAVKYEHNKPLMMSTLHTYSRQQ